MILKLFHLFFAEVYLYMAFTCNKQEIISYLMNIYSVIFPKSVFVFYLIVLSNKLLLIPIYESFKTFRSSAFISKCLMYFLSQYLKSNRFCVLMFVQYRKCISRCPPLFNNVSLYLLFVERLMNIYLLRC